MALARGTHLGPYEVVSPLGAGGMGEVYRARNARLGPDVAIKVLPPDVAQDADRRTRFEREARAVAALSHPNILALFDIGTEGDQLFVVTELLEGESLAERLTHGALPVRKAVEIAVAIARGLSAAHGKGIAHRDLKPANVFLLSDGQVKILDFGLARDVTASSGATQTQSALTDPGTVLGTAGYMAPEQIRGQPVDGRADLFALGVVLYEMLSGTRAFARETTVETLNAILKEDPPELAATRTDLPPALDRIVRHCLDKNPTERFQSAHDVAFALDTLTNLRDSGEARLVPSGPHEPEPVSGAALDRAPRRTWPFAAALVGVAVAAAAAAWISSLNSGLWRVPVEGGTSEQLTKPDGEANGYAHAYPQPLPTGDVFFSFWGKTFYTAVFSSATRTWREATPAGPLTSVHGIYIESGYVINGDYTGGVRAVPWQPASTAPRSPEAEVLDNVYWVNGPDRSWINVSANGTAVYVPGSPQKRHLAWVDRQGQISQLPGEAGPVTKAALSRDCRRVHYDVQQSHWVMDLVTGARSRVGSDGMGGWLPGDERIVISSNKTGDWELYTIGADGRARADTAP